MKEVLELNEFIQFHEKLAASREVGNGKLQCSRASAFRVNLTKHKVNIREVSFTCDCGKTFDLPVPLDDVM